MLEVDRRRRAVILADRFDGAGPVQRGEVVRPCFRVKEIGRLRLAGGVEVEPRHDVGADHRLRSRMALGEEEPVPISHGEGHIDAFEMFERRDDVHGAEPFDRIRMIERHAVGDTRAAVMCHHLEAAIAEGLHQRDQVRRHRPFGIGRMISADRRLGREAVAGDVGADDGEMPRERRCHFVPHGMGLGIAVQQQQGWSIAATTQPKALACRFLIFEREAFEEHRAGTSGCQLRTGGAGCPAGQAGTSPWRRMMSCIRAMSGGPGWLTTSAISSKYRRPMVPGAITIIAFAVSSCRLAW